MTWDEYFLEMCHTVAKNSKCFSRKIGAVLVKDKSIISTGYNGPPRGVDFCNNRHLYDKNLAEEYNKKLGFSYKDVIPRCPRQVLGFKSGEGLEWCVAGHAERNALINAARNGISTKGTKLYMNCPTPCTPCLIEIINAGVEEIIITKEGYYDISAEYLIKNSNLKWRTYEVRLNYLGYLS